MDEKTVRSSQLISPYGPGAIVDIGDESLLLTDLKDWKPVSGLEEINLQRLTNALDGKRFKAPPKQPPQKIDKSKKIGAIRFPRWMFCPSCRKLKSWSSDNQNSKNNRPVCNTNRCNQRKLVPMRFVMACEHGHLGDVPWDRWVHSQPGKKCDDNKNQLYFTSNPARGSGLEALEISCKECGRKKDLGSLMMPKSMESIGVRCSGKQPWESNYSDCDVKPVVLQRGASNLYFPIVQSALDIPVDTDSEGVEGVEGVIRQHRRYSVCREMLIDEKDEATARGFANGIARDLNCTVDEVISTILHQEIKTDIKELVSLSPESRLLADEWAVLSSSIIDSQTQNKNFSARLIDQKKLAEIDKWQLSSIIERLVLLDRLREVRAFCGFDRVKPGQGVMSPAGQHNNINWLPAIEIFGEGIFIQFSDEALNNWINSNEYIQSRLNSMLQRYEEANIRYLPEPTPRLVALHTLAHLLIRQLSFESGYSSGSLRERIYAENQQAGVLIYTADSDSEGSLGGLVQQGEAYRFLPTIAAALDAASWCSNDPVCSEMATQGVMGLNKAACHSCTLVSETSCTMNNLLLDRRLLLGNEDSEYGLFSTSLQIIKQG